MTEIINTNVKFGYYQQTIKDDDNKPQTITKSVELNDEARLSNLLVLSTKRSGKKSYLIPTMFKQDLERKDSGITIICSRSEQAYNLYTMAKVAKRKVQLLKPSANFDVLNNLIYNNKFDRQYLTENVIDYKQAIRDKDVIIIDMEYESYSYVAIRATAMLLMLLQADMNETSVTLRRKHFVYIDEAYRYLEYLDNLLEFGSDYNISTTLFFQSRSQFKTVKRDFTALIDNNIRNTLILQGINYNDAVYYSKRLNIPGKSRPDDLMARDYGMFIYEFLSPGTFKVVTGCAKLLTITEEEREKIYKQAAKHRKNLNKELNKTEDSKILSMLRAQESLDQLNNHLQKETTGVQQDTYLENIESVITENPSTVETKEKSVIEDTQKADETQAKLEELEKSLNNKPSDNNGDIKEVSKEENSTELELDFNSSDISFDLGSPIPPGDNIEEVVKETPKKKPKSSKKVVKKEDIVYNNDAGEGLEVPKGETMFIIGGSIDTTFGQGIRSAKPIRVAQDYMKNKIKEKEFGDMF